ARKESTTRRLSGAGQVGMEAEIIVSLVPVAGRLSVTEEWRAHEAAYCHAGNQITTPVRSGYRIDIPVIASVRSQPSACYLDKRSFWCGRLRPVRCHVDPELVSVRIEEV